MSAETATRASRAMRSSPALVDDAALEDTPFSETEDAMRFRASLAELRMLREARAREDDAIVAKAERGEPLTAEEIVLRARARRDAALRLQRQLDDAVAAAKSTLARWDARGFHRDARFGDAVLADLRRNLQTTKAEVARRVAEELPGILAARRQRERDDADRRAAEAAERERRDDEPLAESRRAERRRAEGAAERPVPDDAARRSPPPPRSSAEALERVLADEPPPPTLPPETNEERRERARARLVDDDVRDPNSGRRAASVSADALSEDASSDFFDDTGDASADVEAERAAWNAELERRRAALAAERAALEASDDANVRAVEAPTAATTAEAPTRSSASERSARFAALAALTSRVFERRGDGNLYETETRDGIGVDATRSESTNAAEACAAVVALIRSVAPGDGEPVPESFASGAFMAVTTRTDARLSESEVAAAEAELRDAQDPDGARLFRELLAHFKSLAACGAMEPRRAARALADATVPTGNSDAARRALVDRFAQLLRALIPDDAERDDAERRPAEGSRRRSVPLGGVIGDALGAPNVPSVPSAAVSSMGGSSTLLVGGARIARGRPGSGGRGLNLSGSAAFAAPAPADLDESDELEAQLRGLPSPTAARAAAEERRRAAAGSNAVESSAEPRNDLRAGTGSGAGDGAGAGAGAAADALDESSFSADDSTVSDAPAAAAGTTNARVGSATATARSSATGRGTGKGPAIAGPTNVGSILTRAMRDESDTDASSSDRSRLLGGGGGDGGDDDESDSFDF